METKVKYSDLQYLTVGLPEDIEKLKWYGDFERAEKVIDMRLEKDIPQALRRRLELEKWILRRLPLEYVYTEEEALKQLGEALEGATAEELEQLRDEGAAEWIFVRGQVRYKDDFLENLLKTRTQLWPRLRDPSRVKGRIEGNRLLDETVRAMKEKGGLAYRMHVRAGIILDKLEKGENKEGALVRVHLPVPVEKGQMRCVKILATSMEPVCVAPADYPQRTVYMEACPEEGQEFWVEYELENHTRYVNLEQERRRSGEPGQIPAGQEPEEGRKSLGQGEGYQEGSDAALYLGEQLPHIRFTPYLKDLTREVVGDETCPLKKARKIYDYITTHVMYSFVRQYSTIANLPEYMATSLKGDCGIYALLFITMCRIGGIPAGWQSGLYATPLDIGCHDWARFYIEPYGWLYADCSFGGAAYRAGAMERWNFYFGNLDPFRIVLCTEFQKEFQPAKTFLREDPYDNQVGEAEYGDRELKDGESRTTRKVLEMEEIALEIQEDIER